MNPVLSDRLHPWMRAYPGAILEVDADGVVRGSNGRLETALERALVGRPLSEALDAPSRLKWMQLRTAVRALADGEPGAWELVLEGRDTLHPRQFHAVPDDDVLLLVEVPHDPRLDRLYEEFTVLNSEQANTQRLLSKEKARLARALDELEREFQENDRLARALQQQNEEMEAQNEELLAMTEELHAGQEQLLALNHQLERRSRELQLALSARNRFYAAMSHELRTPINAVMGYNDLLLASVYGALSERQEMAVERAQRAAQHLRELVNDVLDISRLESGKMEMEAERVDLPLLVEDLFATLRPMAEATGAELRLMAPGSCPSLYTDPRRLRQVLMNLVSNAIKYGAGSPVWVRCEAPPGGGAVVEVVDAGPGIRPEDHTRIFEEFVQLERDENGDSSRLTGTGLGLPIAQRLVRLLGGTLELESTPGVGSVFRLVLPTRPPEP